MWGVCTGQGCAGVGGTGPKALEAGGRAGARLRLEAGGEWKGEGVCHRAQARPTARPPTTTQTDQTDLGPQAGI